METQNNSNELRVEKVDDKEIEKHLKEKNIDIATIIFEASEIEKAMSSDNTSGGASTSAKIEYKDGKVGNIVQKMVPITTTMEIPAKDSEKKEKDDKNKKQEKSEQEKEERE